tara:strand:+ start:632 stop:751 length:120 start_codon:yes stop_codon:yes gene_type:complete
VSDAIATQLVSHYFSELCAMVFLKTPEEALRYSTILLGL